MTGLVFIGGGSVHRRATLSPAAVIALAAVVAVVVLTDRSALRQAPGF